MLKVRLRDLSESFGECVLSHYRSFEVLYLCYILPFRFHRIVDRWSQNMPQAVTFDRWAAFMLFYLVCGRRVVLRRWREGGREGRKLLQILDLEICSMWRCWKRFKELYAGTVLHFYNERFTQLSTDAWFILSGSVYSSSHIPYSGLFMTLVLDSTMVQVLA